MAEPTVTQPVDTAPESTTPEVVTTAPVQTGGTAQQPVTAAPEAAGAGAATNGVSASESQNKQRAATQARNEPAKPAGTAASVTGVTPAATGDGAAADPNSKMSEMMMKLFVKLLAPLMGEDADKLLADLTGKKPETAPASAANAGQVNTLNTATPPKTETPAVVAVTPPKTEPQTALAAASAGVTAAVVAAEVPADLRDKSLKELAEMMTAPLLQGFMPESMETQLRVFPHLMGSLEGDAAGKTISISTEANGDMKLRVTTDMNSDAGNKLLQESYANGIKQFGSVEGLQKSMQEHYKPLVESGTMTQAAADMSVSIAGKAAGNPAEFAKLSQGQSAFFADQAKSIGQDPNSLNKITTETTFHPAVVTASDGKGNTQEIPRAAVEPKSITLVQDGKFTPEAEQMGMTGSVDEYVKAQKQSMINTIVEMRKDNPDFLKEQSGPNNPAMQTGQIVPPKTEPQTALAATEVVAGAAVTGGASQPSKSSPALESLDKSTVTAQGNRDLMTNLSEFLPGIKPADPEPANYVMRLQEPGVVGLGNR